VAQVSSSSGEHQVGLVALRGVKSKFPPRFYLDDLPKTDTHASSIQK
jgi:hypothetical protein